MKPYQEQQQNTKNQSTYSKVTIKIYHKNETLSRTTTTKYEKSKHIFKNYD